MKILFIPIAILLGLAAAKLWIKFVLWITYDDQHLVRIALMIIPVILLIIVIPLLGLNDHSSW